MEKKAYKKALYALQVELVKFHKSVIDEGKKVCVLFEGRDAAGKDGTIKRFCEHLSPREVRTVALGKPTDHDTAAWYFQRYVPHLPVSGEIVFFNRSWYNRAGVERVMGFCSEHEYRRFMEEVMHFERLLAHGEIHFFKYYLDISRSEQESRLNARKKDPLKQLSPIDEKAPKLWKAYSQARDAMFERTSFDFAPWYVVHSDNKKAARINAMRHFLGRVEYPGKNEEALQADPEVVFEFEPDCFERGLIAP